MESDFDLVNSNFFRILWVSNENINLDLEAREGSYLNNTGLHNLYEQVIGDDLTQVEVNAMIMEVEPDKPGKIYEDDFIKIMKKAKNGETSSKWSKIYLYIEGFESNMKKTSVPKRRRMRFVGGRCKSRKTSEKQQISKKRPPSRKRRK
uniref:EF-hand domain-containing protein n=1 Tax=viral metagenome TaxID=1070528 RepID=A0A6C0I5D3_9ZZZZ